MQQLDSIVVISFKSHSETYRIEGQIEQVSQRQPKVNE